MNMAAAREKERPLNSGMESARCESSTLAREEEQKSKDCLRAATSLSFESVSASLAPSAAATGNLGAEEIVESRCGWPDEQSSSGLQWA